MDQETENRLMRQRRARQKAKQRQLRRLRRGMVACVTVLVVTFCLFFVFLWVRVEREQTVEAGTPVTAELFKRFDWDREQYELIRGPESTALAGDYSCKIRATLFSYSVTLHVTDTTKPEADGLQVCARYADTVTPEQFVTDIRDAAPCTVTFLTVPDTKQYGLQRVEVQVTDANGNATEVIGELLILNVRTTLTLEAGSAFPAPEEFLAEPGGEIVMTAAPDPEVMRQPGSYEVTLLADGIEAVSVLEVVDTTAPKLVTKAETTYLNKPLEAADFVVQVQDVSGTVIAYAAEPDWTAEGTQKIGIVATDDYGNRTEQQAELTILKDTGKPDIQVSDIDVVVGGTVSYRKAVNYYDDIDTKEELTLTIDRDGVDLNTVGTYSVTYTVTDHSGNSASATGKVHVLAEEPVWKDEEAIHAKADQVLASILTEGMTDREKAKKIYRWLKSNISYISHSEKGDYMRGAYEGLFKKQGDCFVYAATAKELLTRAGIKNMDIVKATVNPSHYWNLVDVGDGWYHFDATPRKDKSEFFLLTDEELAAYSKAHKNSHNFDRSLYPKIQ